MITMKVKVGIVGTGMQSYHQARGWRTHPDAEIAAVCDNDEWKLESKAEAWGVKKKYTSYDELVKDPEINAVDIILPHYLHADCAIKAAEAGKHVLLQKPMAMSTKECDAIISAAKKAGVKLMYLENYMYYPPMEKAKELIVKGEIGRPSIIRVESDAGFGGVSKDFVESQTKEGLGPSLWRSDKKTGGGSIFDDGVHHFALARWLMSTDEKKRNEIKSVFGFFNLETERPGVIVWDHCDGGYGNLSYSDRAEIELKLVDVHGRYGMLHEGFHVIGTKGIIWVTRCTERMLGEAPVILYKAEEGERITFEDINDDWSDSFTFAVHHFIDCIVNDKQPNSTGEDGKKCAQVAYAAHKAGRERKAVEVGTVHELPF
jgi:predicted dehydrogenase